MKRRTKKHSFVGVQHVDLVTELVCSLHVRTCVNIVTRNQLD